VFFPKRDEFVLSNAPYVLFPKRGEFAVPNPPYVFFSNPTNLFFLTRRVVSQTRRICFF